jgi:HSP20 family protein
MPATSEIENPTKERETTAKTSKELSRTESKNGNGNNNSRENGITVESGSKQEVAQPEGVERTRTGRVFTPAVDIYETAESVVLVADMPGVTESSVDVTLEKNVLTIYGRVEPQQPAGHALAYSEYRTGDYQRSFTISNAIDWEHIEGSVRNGVLKLTLPKAGPARTKRIEIKGA